MEVVHEDVVQDISRQGSTQIWSAKTVKAVPQVEFTKIEFTEAV